MLYSTRTGGPHEAFEGIGVTTLPGRKRPSLYSASGNKFTLSMAPLASFSSEAAAEEALRLLDKLARAKYEPKEEA